MPARNGGGTRPVNVPDCPASEAAVGPLRRPGGVAAPSCITAATSASPEMSLVGLRSGALFAPRTAADETLVLRASARTPPSREFLFLASAIMERASPQTSSTGSSSAPSCPARAAEATALVSATRLELDVDRGRGVARDEAPGRSPPQGRAGGGGADGLGFAGREGDEDG